METIYSKPYCSAGNYLIIASVRIMLLLSLVDSVLLFNCDHVCVISDRLCVTVCDHIGVISGRLCVTVCDHVAVIFGRLCITFRDDAGALFAQWYCLSIKY